MRGICLTCDTPITAVTFHGATYWKHDAEHKVTVVRNGQTFQADCTTIRASEVAPS